MEKTAKGKAVKASAKKQAEKKQAKKPYVSILKRPYKNNTEFSSAISLHSLHHPSASAIRGKENSRMRETLLQGKAKSIEIPLSLFASLFKGKSEKAIEDLFKKKSFFKKLETDIMSILEKEKLTRKGIYSFPYRVRDTKEGNKITLAKRIRTACKALYLHKEKLEQIEIHKIK